MGGRMDSSRVICLIAVAGVATLYLLASVAIPASLVDPDSGDVLPGAQATGEVLGRSGGHAAKHRFLDIWSLTSAGVYLWCHVLHGTLSASAGGRMVVGKKTIGNWTIRFSNGKDLSPSYIRPDAEFLVLAVNGRAKQVRTTVFHWLNEVRSLSHLKHVGVMLIGSERCDNRWLQSQLSDLPTVNRKLHTVWVTYDHALLDGVRFFQWPLGVATYRNFPVPVVSDAEMTQTRRYACNFLGTVYAGSSRVELGQILQNVNRNSATCFTKIRTEWVAHEAADSMAVYLDALKNSDLTLCPVGQNAESYRIYEAMAMGSVPVIELSDPTGSCQQLAKTHYLIPLGKSPRLPPMDGVVQGPYRMLKAFRAPVIFINSWAELPAILSQEQRMTVQEKVERRRYLLQWYSDFRETLSQSFLHSVDLMAERQ